MQGNPRHDLRYENQQKIELMDSMKIQFLLTVPQKKKYDAMVKKKLEDVSRQLKNNQYQLALTSFIDLRNNLLAEQFWQQWGRIDLQLRLKTITNEFIVFLQELKQERKQKEKLETDSKKKFIDLIKSKELQDKNIELLNLLSSNKLKLGLELAENVPQFNRIGQIIKEVLEYRWLISRHNAYHCTIKEAYTKWRFQQMDFKEESTLLKEFIDIQYRNCSDRDKDLQIVYNQYFQTKEFHRSFQKLSNKFNKEILKKILQSHFKQYQYVEWFIKAQRQLIKNKVFEEDYFTGRQVDKIQFVKQKINNIMQSYFQTRPNTSLTSRYDSRLSLSTARSSSIFIEGIEITQDQFGSFVYKETSVKNLYENSKLLKQQLKQSQETEKKMKEQMDNMHLQINRLNTQLAKLNDKNTQVIHQNQVLTKQIHQLEKELKTNNEKIRMAQIKFELLDHDSISLIEGESYVESISQKYQSTLLLDQKDEKNTLINTFINDMPLFKIQRLQKIFQYGEMNKQGNISQGLIDSIRGTNNLLFIIKLAKQNQIISAFFERGFLPNHSSVNRSQISQLQSLRSQLSQSSRGSTQSDVIRDSNNSSFAFLVQEPLENAEQGFIIAHWKNQQVFPFKKTHLLKVDKSRIILGQNFLVINILKGQVKSNIEKYATHFVCTKSGNQGQMTKDIKFLGSKGGESGVKFQKFQIYHLKLNSDTRSSFKKQY